MKHITCTLSSALLVSMTTLLPAAELRIYQIDLRGKAPDLASFCKALDEESTPGLLIHAVPVQEDGKVELDLTRHDLPVPDPAAKDPRRVGVLIKGQLDPAEQEAGRRLKLRIRDCKHTAYIYGEGEKKFHPTLTESSVEVLCRLAKDGWGMIDMDPDAKDSRKVFVVRLTD